MTGIYLLVPTLLTVFISFLVVRAGAIALMMSGMDQEKARFQALSAFSRAGFTTREAELVVNNPRRRRIITWLIILGNAGLVAVIVTATSSIAISQGYHVPITIVALLAGGFALYMLVNRTGFARRWEGFIENRLVKAHILEEGTTEDLLHLIEGYGLARVIITQDSPHVGRSLVEANTPENEFWVVGIERGKEWISLPRSRETINEGDKLVVYGNLNTLRSLFKES
jgi:hypothetical protein